MKKIFLLFVLFVSVNFLLQAQQPTACNVPPFCDYDLVNTPPFQPTDIIVSNDIYYGKTNSQFTDVELNGDALKTICITQDDCLTSTLELKYNVYYPKMTAYNFSTCPPLPCIIFVHGGGISDCSHYVQEPSDELKTLLRYMARCGFVVFNVEYRRGRIEDPNSITVSGQSFTPLSVQQELANYKAAQDARGAIRSIIKRQSREGLDGNDDVFRIDLDKIFLAGNSGGAISLLNAVFYQDQTRLNAVFPSDPSSPGTIQDALGPILPDYYYAENNNTSWDFRNRIKGILSMWGAVSVPPAYNASNAENFFNTNPHPEWFPPIIAFHGKFDPVVPCNTQPVYLSPNVSGHQTYNATNFCLRPSYMNQFFYADKTNNSLDLNAIGSEDFSLVLGRMGIVSEVYIDCQMGHGIEDGVTGGGTDKTDYFGLGANTTKAKFYTYIAQRACTFFQLILNGITYSDTTYVKRKFIECKNNRVTCLKGDNYSQTCCESCNAVRDNTNHCNRSEL